MKKKLLGLILSLAMVFTLWPAGAVTAFAAGDVEVSGTVNASSLEDGAGLILTGDTELVMDTARTLAWINCDRAYDASDSGSREYTHELTIRGEGVLTVTNCVAISKITLDGAKLTVNGPEGVSGPGDFTITNSEVTAVKMNNGAAISVTDSTVRLTGTSANDGINCSGNASFTNSEVTAASLSSGAAFTAAESTLNVTGTIGAAAEISIADSEVSAEVISNGQSRTITNSTLNLTGSIGGGGDTTILKCDITCTGLSNSYDITVRESDLTMVGERPGFNCGGRVVLENCDVEGVISAVSCGGSRTITNTDLVVSGSIGGGSETTITDSNVTCAQISNGGDIIIRNSSVSTQSEYGITNGEGVEITDSSVTLEGSFSVSEEITFVNSTVDVGGKIANGGDVTLDRSRVVVHGTGCERGVSLPGKLTVGNGSTLTAEGSVMAVGATNGITIGDMMRIVEPAGGTIGQTNGSVWTMMNTDGVPAARVRFSFLFTDVTDPSQFYYNAVYWAADEGITTGWADMTFRPMNICNRASVVTFLWRLAGCPEASAPAQFSDMTGNADFDRAIAWAAENGITTGWEDGTFRPWNRCNRASIVTFLYRYAKLMNGGEEPAQGSQAAEFPDMTSNEDFNRAIVWAASNGITTGYSDGTFGPWKPCTRMAVVSFLYRYAMS
ncbi:MAG: S-layer homology domain-containing protein [Lachnospiraceae bacterium]|nr:S-layer homology domain-containing protein [Lachnospiraceae bacterium]